MYGVASLSKMLIPLCHTACLHIPNDNNFHNHIYVLCSLSWACSYNGQIMNAYRIFTKQSLGKLRSRWMGL
jgi:hypothetical protein